MAPVGRGGAFAAPSSDARRPPLRPPRRTAPGQHRRICPLATTPRWGGDGSGGQDPADGSRHERRQRSPGPRQLTRRRQRRAHQGEAQANGERAQPRQEPPHTQATPSPRARHAGPCHAGPCHAGPCHAGPCHAEPCRAGRLGWPRRDRAGRQVHARSVQHASARARAGQSSEQRRSKPSGLILAPGGELGCRRALETARASAPTRRVAEERP